MKKIIIFAAVVFGVGLAACSDDNGGGSDSNEPVRISLNGPEKRVSRAAQDLAVRTFAEIYDDDVNVAFSPLSAQIALAMAANGATEETLEEMLEQLCSGGDVEHLNSLYGKLCAGLPLLDAKSTVDIANSFWHSDGFEVLPSFCMSLSENYTAPTASYDISSPAAAAELVNKWIEKSTKGKISNIIGANDVKAYMIVNALYFKSQWCEKFDKDKTRPDKFTNSDGSVSDVQFMNGVVEDT